MSHQHATLEDTVYLWFGANDTSGSGGDGASAAADVRLAGAAADAAPVLSPTPSLLSHANYPAGCHEVAVAATAANGFAAGNTYGVFCTLLIDSQNPTGFVGSFTLGPVPAKLSAAGRNALADALLSRNVSNVEAAVKAAGDEHSLSTVILAILESVISGTTWTIKQTDGGTTQFTKTVTVDADANPITGVS